MSYVLVGRILGLSEERARLGAELGIPTQAAADTMRDLLADAQAGRLSVPIEELERHGIRAEDVLAHSSSWETLARVDGLAEWCIEWARTQRVLLEETVLPTLRKEFFPYIRPRWRRSRLLVQMKHRIDFLERYERQWRKRSGAARPDMQPGVTTVVRRYCAFPGDEGLGEDAYAAMLDVPQIWLREGVDALAAAARVFGVPVSNETLERWLRAWACAHILDRFLDDSEDRVAALQVYRRLLRSLGTEPSPLPPWVAPRIPTSVALLMGSLADTGSRDGVIDLAIRMGELAPQKADCSRPWAYARLVRRENTIFGQLLADCTSATERNAARFRTFRRFCSMYMKAWGLLDATVDLRPDSCERKVRIRFTRRSRAVLWAHWVWAWAAIIVRHPIALDAVANAIQRLRAESALASADTTHA